MNILVVGSGGREHAIIYALKKNKNIDEIFAFPGNAGIEEIATCIDGKFDDLEKIEQIALDKDIDMVIIGPEVPLCEGIVDRLRKIGKAVVGPSKEAAKLEGSKIYGKKFMEKYNIPTAKYLEFENRDEAIETLEEFSYPVVIKDDGLAAGKGVVIAKDRSEAIEAINTLLHSEENQEIEKSNVHNRSKAKIIIEEFLEGFECSILCLVDGENIIPLESAKDHKQIFDGGKGPNTGGMGTVSPNPLVDERLTAKIEEKILKPVLEGIKKEGLDYRGILFIGLMIDKKDIKVLEFNVRFGDPETQSVLLRLETDLYDVLKACNDKELKNLDIKWSDKEAACIVLASGGYPGPYEKGKEIKNLDKISDDIILFHSGTKLSDGKIVTDGGRVLNICALDDNLDKALEKVYKAAELIDFEGKYYRRDIGKI